MSRVPIQTRLAGYKKLEGLFKLVFHQEINYFNFRSLSYSEKVLDVFDVTDCIAAPSRRKYFDLYVKFDGEMCSILVSFTSLSFYFSILLLQLYSPLFSGVW